MGFDTKLKFVRKTLVELPFETHFTYWYSGKFPGRTINIELEEIEQARFFSKQDFEDLIKSDDKITRTSESIVRQYWKGEFSQTS